MTRTYRNTENAGYCTRPKTLNYKKGLIRTREEIIEDGGIEHLKSNNKSHKNIVSSWDDKYVSAREETLMLNEYMERIYLNNFNEKSWGLNINFNRHKNRYEVGRKYHCNKDVYYIPFTIIHKRIKYPVEISLHNWYY